MSTIRLTFLYPHLYKPRICHNSAAAYKQLRNSHNRTSKASFSTKPRRLQEEIYAQRYGTAAEPQLPPPSQPPSFSGPGRDGSLAGAIETEVKAPPTKQEEKKAEPVPSKETSKQEEDSKKAREEIVPSKSPIGEKARKLDASESHPKENVAIAREASNKPLETVLYRETPTQDNLSEHKPPHLQAPPYVHHFDTFTLVRDLQKGGFTQDQSVTLMKAVRSLLSLNLDVARDGLISKSDVENVQLSLSSPHSYISNLTSPSGNIPLPRRLLRAPHRNPQCPPLLPPTLLNTALPPKPRNRNHLPAPRARHARSERRAPRHVQRPSDGRKDGAAGRRAEYPRTQLQNHSHA